MNPPQQGIKTAGEICAEKLTALSRLDKHWQEMAATIVDDHLASIEQENQRLKENPQVGTCCICGSAIWHKEARMTDERGTFHPICAIKQENQRLREALQRIADDKECTFAQPLREIAQQALATDTKGGG